MKNNSPQKSPGSIMTFGLLGLVCVLSLGSLISIYKYQMLPPFIQVEQPKIWDFEAQMKIFIKFAFFHGLIIFINTVVLAQTRVYQWRVEPQQGQDTQLITILNQILRNNLEQSVPFLLIFLYWLVYKARIEEINLAYCFGFYFLAYRMTFFVGYITALMIKTSILRGFGFSGAAITTLLVITKCLGFNIV